MKFMLHLLLCFTLLSTVGCTSSTSQLDIAISKAMSKQTKIDNINGPKLICKPVPLDDSNIQTSLPTKSIQAITRFETQGFPLGKYEFYAIRLDNSKVLIGKYYMDEQGEFQLIDTNQKAPLSEYLLYSFACIQGESIHFVLVSEDRAYAASDFIIPNPIETKWSDGALVSMIALGPSMECFLIQGSGFKSKENIEIISCVSGASGSSDLTANTTGAWNRLLDAVDPCETGGRGALIIKRANGEIKTIKYYHGTDALKTIFDDQ